MANFISHKARDEHYRQLARAERAEQALHATTEALEEIAKIGTPYDAARAREALQVIDKALGEKDG